MSLWPLSLTVVDQLYTDWVSFLLLLAAVSFILCSVAVTASRNTLTSASFSFSSVMKVCWIRALDKVSTVNKLFPDTCTISNENLSSLSLNLSTLCRSSSRAFGAKQWH